MITHEQCATNEPQQPHCSHLHHWRLVIRCGGKAALHRKHLGPDRRYSLRFSHLDSSAVLIQQHFMEENDSFKEATVTLSGKGDLVIPSTLLHPRPVANNIWYVYFDVSVLKKTTAFVPFGFFRLSSRANLSVIFGRCRKAEAKQRHQKRRRGKKNRSAWPENYNQLPAAVVGLLSLRLGKVKEKPSIPNRKWKRLKFWLCCCVFERPAQTQVTQLLRA